MNIQSTGSSQGMKGCLWQSGIPLHMVPPPTSLSPFSSLPLFHCCLSASEIQMKQLQRRGDQNGLQGSFDSGTLMLNTPFTGTDHLLHLHCHARPPKPVLQQEQCSLLALMPRIPMAPVHGHYFMSHGELQTTELPQAPWPEYGGDRWQPHGV